MTITSPQEPRQLPTTASPKGAMASRLPLLLPRSHGQPPTTTSPKEPRPAAYHRFSRGAMASCLPLLLPRSHSQLPTTASPQEPRPAAYHRFSHMHLTKMLCCWLMWLQFSTLPCLLSVTTEWIMTFLSGLMWYEMGHAI